ncbi:sigma-70 RNA polymerase sigma factor region 4 domain-containing protein [Amycolatopsis samaneae]|uniref:Uncharacterized protein n=1 Tax=Amycolatopsis samaneae TaxID=664691 RepID=A0ABW5GP75_9PSEU
MSSTFQPRPLREIQRRLSLTISTSSIAFDGWSLSSDLPDQMLSLAEVVDLAQLKTTSPDAKAAIWAEVVRLAQTDPQLWRPVVVILAAPALVNMARQVAEEFGVDADDAEGDLVVGLLEAAQTADPSMRGLAAHLKRVARTRAMYTSSMRETNYHSDQPMRAVPLAPRSGHVDMVLADAIAQNFLTRAESELIARTRIEGLAISVVARELGFPPGHGAVAREHAERKLLEYLSRSGR